MGLGASILLIAVGAILRWGVTADVSGLEVSTIGTILMVVGAIGLVLSLVFWSTLGFGTRRTVADDDVVVREERHYDDIDRAA
jgi:hypothetical protein